jgi:hypothetical protein
MRTIIINQKRQKKKKTSPLLFAQQYRLEIIPLSSIMGDDGCIVDPGEYEK